jgi:hypothetical protein
MFHFTSSQRLLDETPSVILPRNFVRDVKRENKIRNDGVKSIFDDSFSVIQTSLLPSSHDYIPFQRYLNNPFQFISLNKMTTWIMYLKYFLELNLMTISEA